MSIHATSGFILPYIDVRLNITNYMWCTEYKSMRTEEVEKVSRKGCHPFTN